MNTKFLDKTTTQYHRAKSSVFYLLLLALWILATALVAPAWFTATKLAHGVLDLSALVFIGLCIETFSFFAFWHILVVFFHIAGKLRFIGRPNCQGDAAPPKVAVLYLTCDDFSYDSAKSCVDIDFPAFRVFILDDSTKKEFKNQVDRFAREHVNIVEVVRRNNRAGFKSGNINNALQKHLHGYEYLVLADADEELPHDFVAKAVDAFGADDNIAFVQAKHRCRVSQNNPFSTYFSTIIDAMWEFYQDYRNRFGTVCCLGHGVAIKVKALRQVAGFPNVVSEDLALTMVMRKASRIGSFRDDIVALEGFPESLVQYRQRFFRWTMADCQCLIKCVLPFLLEKEISWCEKLDIFVREVRMSISSLFLPLVLVGWLAHSSAVNHLVSSWQVVFIGLIAFAAPTAAIMLYQERSIGARIKLSLFGISVYMSFAVLSLQAVAYFLIKRRIDFTVTGRRTIRREIWGANGAGTKVLELLIGTLLASAAIVQNDLIIGGIAIALLLAPIYVLMDWRSPITRLTAVLPAALVLAGVATAVTAGPEQGRQTLCIAAMATLLFS